MLRRIGAIVVLLSALGLAARVDAQCCQVGGFCVAGLILIRGDCGSAPITPNGTCQGGTCPGDGNLCSGTCTAPADTPTCTPTETPTETPTCTPTETPTMTATPLPKNLGESCSAPMQCASGFCTQGVCCDQNCSGPGETCSRTGSLGTCVQGSEAPAMSTTKLLLLVAVLGAFGILAIPRWKSR